MCFCEAALLCLGWIRAMDRARLLTPRVPGDICLGWSCSKTPLCFILPPHPRGAHPLGINHPSPPPPPPPPSRLRARLSLSAHPEHPPANLTPSERGSVPRQRRLTTGGVFLSLSASVSGVWQLASWDTCSGADAPGSLLVKKLGLHAFAHPLTWTACPRLGIKHL